MLLRPNFEAVLRHYPHPEIVRLVEYTREAEKLYADLWREIENNNAIFQETKDQFKPYRPERFCDE